MMPLGLDNLVTIDDEAFAKTFNAGQRGHSEEGGKQAQARHWGIGEMEFEASMRILDNSGYRTGHTYRSGNKRTTIIFGAFNVISRLQCCLLCLSA